MTPTAAPSSAAWRNRIVGSGEVDPRELIPNPGNWRRHPSAQAKAMEGALDQVGWVQQVMVNRRSGRMVDGHMRVELALARGDASVPVVFVDLGDDEERLVLASLDPIGAMADTDGAKLREVLAGVTVDSADLLRMLKALAPNREGLTDPDELPPMPKEIYVQPGEVWVLGDHRLVCGDATDPATVERLLDGATPRLLVTDPPYGVQLDPTWRDGVYNNRLGGKNIDAAKPYMRIEGHQNTTLSGDTIVDWSGAFALVPSIEVAYVWHAGVHAPAVAEGLARISLEIRSQIIWAKSQFAMSRSAYHWQHEPCWYAVRKGRRSGWIGDHALSTVWELASPKMIMGGSDEDKFDHPAQKPIECMARPIRNHEGDVYEPFAGSGTTLIGAEQAGRHCYAIEIDPLFAQISIERWQAFTGREAVRG